MTGIVAGFLTLELVTICAFLAIMHDRDDRERTERATLLQRIQAPELAVQQAIEEKDDPLVPLAEEIEIHRLIHGDDS